MKHLKILVAFLGFMLMASPAVSALANATDTNPVTVGLAVVALAMVVTIVSPRKNEHVHTAGVEVEIWVNYLIERFWKDNTFLKNVFNDSQFVLSGKVVHIPQIGAKPEVIKNRNVFPAVAVGRADSDISYILEPYTTTPTHIQDAEKYEVSYNKIDSVLGDHAAVINEAVAEDLIVKWLTGLSSDAKMSTTGATSGSVKLFTTADLRRAMTKFNKDGVPQANRFVMPSANMLDHLIQSMSDTQYKDFSQYLDAKTGVIGKLFGFTFLDRSTVANVDAAGAVKPIGSAAVGTDVETSLIWQKDALAAAIGEVKFFDNVNDPQYYGDIYSTLLRAGGRRRRSDDKGIIQLSQGAA